MNRQNQVRKKNDALSVLLQIAIVLLLAVQLLSYFGAEWELETHIWTGRVTATQFAGNSMLMILARYLSFFIILFVFLITVKFSLSETVFFFVMFSVAVFHTLYMIAEVGFVEFLWRSDTPLVYMMIVGFWIGKNQKMWIAIKKLIPILLTIYIAAFLITFLTFVLDHEWAIFGNSSLMNYFSHVFALAIPFFYIRLNENKAGLAVYLPLVFLLVGAVVVRSRAWTIQSVLLLVVVSLAMVGLRGGGLTKLVRFAGIYLLVVGVVVFLMNNFLGDFWKSLVEKGQVDSRSFQYIEMLEQTEWYAWIFGKGATATYVSKLYGEYSYIDNEFFYIAFHYGAVFVFLYFLPFVRTAVACLASRKKMRMAVFAAALIIMWLLSVNGLSVYHRIHLDVKSFVIPAFIGHLYSETRTLRKEMKSQ